MKQKRLTGNIKIIFEHIKEICEKDRQFKGTNQSLAILTDSSEVTASLIIGRLAKRGYIKILNKYPRIIELVISEAAPIKE